MKTPALAAALALLLPLRAFALRPITAPAPEFPNNAVWLNSKPFSLEQLRKRRVVLAAFLDTDNLNSLRAIEALKIWQARYEFDGLLVIGINTPDLSFQRNPRRALAQFKRLGVDFPVVLDNNHELWNGYANEGWPTLYLLDTQGKIVFDRQGEGGYAEFEKEIRAALEEGGFNPVPAQNPPPDRNSSGCGEATSDARAGLSRGTPLHVAKKSGRADKNYLLSVRQGEISHTGSWSAEVDALRLTRKNEDQTASVHVLYRGAQSFAVLGPPPGGGRYYIRQDNLWLHSGNAGSDVRIDDDGRSFIDASEPRLYHLTQNQSDSMHDLALMPVKADSAVYLFSFANQCLTVQLPP